MTNGEVDDEMSRELNTLAAAYALDSLPFGERREFESLLPEHPELDREVLELRSAAALLGEPVALTAPAHVRSLVLARIGSVRQLPPQVSGVHASSGLPVAPAGGTHLSTVPAGGPVVAAAGAAEPGGVSELSTHRARRAARLSAGRRTVLTAAVAAAVAAGAVVVGYQFRPAATSPFAAVLAQPDVRTTQVSAGGAAKAVLAWSQTEKRLVVQVDSLADAPTGHTYQLWLIPSSGAAVSEGVFAPDNGSATLSADGLGGQETVGITVEPAGGSRQPTTTPILSTPLT